MREIDSGNLIYRDTFLEENELNLDCAVDFSPKMIDDLLSTYGGRCEFVEHYYCCMGLDQCCWTEMNIYGNWDLTQKKIVSHLKECINDLLDFIAGIGRVFIKISTTSAHLCVFARDLPGERDIIVHFGSN